MSHLLDEPIMDKENVPPQPTSHSKQKLNKSK
jgi:hypothetical protein